MIFFRWFCLIVFLLSLPFSSLASAKLSSFNIDRASGHQESICDFSQKDLIEFLSTEKNINLCTFKVSKHSYQEVVVAGLNMSCFRQSAVSDKTLEDQEYTKPDFSSAVDKPVKEREICGSRSQKFDYPLFMGTVVDDFVSGKIKRRGGSERIVVYDGEIDFDEEKWPVMIREYSGAPREGDLWDSFQRQCRWGYALQNNEGFVRMYGSFDAAYNIDTSIPTCCAFYSCPMSLSDLLIERFEEQQKSEKKLNFSGILGLVYELIRSVNILLDQENAVHINLNPRSIMLVFPDESEDSEPKPLIGGYDNIFETESDVDFIFCPYSFFPPECIDGIVAGQIYQASTALMKWQLGITIGMVASNAIFKLFYSGEEPLELETESKVRDTRFACSLQAKVAETMAASGAAGLENILPTTPLSSLSRDLCFPSEPPSPDVVLLIMAWYLLHPDIARRPELADLISFMSQFSDLDLALADFSEVEVLN